MFCTIACWILAWQALNFVLAAVNPYFSATYNKLDATAQGYWNASAISSIMSVLLSGAAIVTQAESTDLFSHTALNSGIMQAFVGYLCSDAALVLYHQCKWPGSTATLVHHGVSMVTTLHVLRAGPAGVTLLLQMLLGELSTPFVNQRYFLDTMGMKESGIYAVNGVLLLAFWFVFRIVNMGVVCWRFLEAREAFQQNASFNVNAVFAATLLVYGLQYVWFYKIVKGAVKVCRKLKSA